MSCKIPIRFANGVRQVEKKNELSTRHRLIAAARTLNERTSGLLSKGIHLPPKAFSVSAGLTGCSDIARSDGRIIVAVKTMSWFGKGRDDVILDKIKRC